MDLITRQFRGILIAVIVLGLSAGAVFAGQVALQASTAGQSAEQTDKNSQGADENDNEAPDADEDADANEQETPEAPDADEQNVEATDTGNHGALVSTAAHMTTPAGFKNHGAFVSCVAHMKDIPAGMTIAQVLAAVTPDACAAARAARDNGVGLSPDERDELNAQDANPAKDAEKAAKAADKAAAKADRIHGKSGKHGHGRGHNGS